MKFFQSLLLRDQIELEKSMRGSNFIVNCVHLLYCKYHKRNLKKDAFYIDFDI